MKAPAYALSAAIAAMHASEPAQPSAGIPCKSYAIPTGLHRISTALRTMRKRIRLAQNPQMLQKDFKSD